MILRSELVRNSRTRSFCWYDVLGGRPWHEGIDVAGEVAVGQLREQVAQIGIEFDAVHLAPAVRLSESQLQRIATCAFGCG